MKDCAKSVPQVRLELSNARCLKGTAPRLRTPTDAVELLRKTVGRNAAQENFVALYVGPANDVLATQVVAVGGLDQAAVDPRVLLSGALLSGASAMLIGHNHPSGNVEPSTADLALTRQLVESARVMTIRLLDHIIFSDTDDYSLVAHGQMTFTTGG